MDYSDSTIVIDMSNGNLIPTPIVDKNGRQTTVRRKAAAPAVPSNLIPRVSSSVGLVSDPPRIGEPGFALYKMKNALSYIPRLDIDDETINKILADIRPETLESLDKLSGTWRESVPIISYCAENATKERSVASFNNLALFQHLAADAEGKVRFAELISGLQAYNLVEGEVVDYTAATAEQASQARALLKVTLGINPKHWRASTYREVRRMHLSSPHLVKMIQKRPEDADRLIAIMNQHTGMLARSPAHIAALESMLDQNIANSLIDGIL
jgi:hypothetical protein